MLTPASFFREEIKRISERVEKIWEQRCFELATYSEAHGDANVPIHGANRPLGAWVASQRSFYRDGKLSEERINRLKNLGFDFNFTLTSTDAWEQRFKDLEEYKQQNGNVDVPSRYAPNPKLGNWVQTQRCSYKENKLSEDREFRLRQLKFHFGVSWNPRPDYVKLLGNANVPRGYEANLGGFVNFGTQRALYGHKNLSEEHISKLKKLDLALNATETLWEQRSGDLAIIKELINANVKQRYDAIGGNSVREHERINREISRSAVQHEPLNIPQQSTLNTQQAVKATDEKKKAPPSQPTTRSIEEGEGTPPSSPPAPKSIAQSKQSLLLAINESEKSLGAMHDWYRLQGVRKNHMGTVVKTRKSRAKVKAFLLTGLTNAELLKEAKARLHQMGFPSEVEKDMPEVQGRVASEL